jgi:lipoate-protein ligase B
VSGDHVITVRDLGRTDYLEALALQRACQAARADGEAPDTLFLTEHEPVLTLGRTHPEPDLRQPMAAVEAAGISIVQTERGGDITYHGPGQLVVYGIIDIKDWGIGAVDYVSGLEEAAIRLLAEWGITARRRAQARGAWVGERKIASVGVNVRRRVAMHGIAINLAPNLEHFALINPCGLAGVEMTSVLRETGRNISVPEAGAPFVRQFEAVFGCSAIMRT